MLSFESPSLLAECAGRDLNGPTVTVHARANDVLEALVSTDWTALVGVAQVQTSDVAHRRVVEASRRSRHDHLGPRARSRSCRRSSEVGTSVASGTVTIGYRDTLYAKCPCSTVLAKPRVRVVQYVTLVRRAFTGTLLSVLVANCGARTGLESPDPTVDARAVIDAGRDAIVANDAPRDVALDIARDVPPIRDVVDVPPVRRVVQLVSGSLHSCVRMDDATVRCWGQYANALASLGPVPMQGVTDVVQLDAGFSHTCALVRGGRMRCWGQNNGGQLGNGSRVEAWPAVDVLGLSDVVSIAAGGLATCAILADATLRCWGSNSWGQLGVGTTADDRLTPTTVALPGGVVAVELGGYHSCARLAAGTVYCWGSDAYGQLGDGTRALRRPTPILVSSLSSVAQLSFGDRHSCGLFVGGTVSCWGEDHHGQVGDGTLSDHIDSPVRVLPLADVVEISAGTFHSCARLRDGTVRCWGQNDNGQLGDGTTTQRTTPVAVMGLTDVAEIAAGDLHTCARLNSGGVRCWGDDRIGQLGNGLGPDSRTPVAVMGL